MCVQFFFTAPGPITELMVLNTTSSTVTYAWEEPACGQRRGVIFGYYYILYQDNNVIVSQGETSDWETEITFYDLEGCTSYDFQVLLTGGNWQK